MPVSMNAIAVYIYTKNKQFIFSEKSTISSWVEVCKWFGFVGMVADHGHKAGLWVNGQWWHAAGRLAFPFFVFAFSYAVIRLSVDAKQIRWGKLVVMGCVAQVIFPFAVGTSWWSLNILFVFLVGWMVWFLACRGRIVDWLVVFILLATTYPLFAPASYGGLGPVLVALALGAWSCKGWWRALFGGMVCGLLFILIASPSWQMVCIFVAVVVTVVCVGCAGIRIPRSQFATWYIAHLFGIVVWKCFVTKEGVIDMMQCSAADVAARSGWLLGVPLMIILAVWVLWSCYGKAKWLPQILMWRAAVRARLFKL